MKKLLKNKENQIILGIMLLVMAVAISPLISRYCINGHDLDYHLLRIEALKENILIGRPFLKVNTLFFGGAGYASSMFYSDFLLYIPAVMRALGVSINASYHIFVFICMVCCMASSYFCVYKMTGSKYTGLIAGIMLSLCAYHMDDVMVRAAVGEYMAFIFVPFVLYGIYNVLYEDMSKPWLIAIGFGGVLLSHTATTLMCIIFAVAAFLIKIKTFIKNPQILIRLIVTAIITALITASYWLPMMEQFLSCRFYISSGGGVDMLDAAVDFSQVLSNQFPSIGLSILLPVVFRAFVKKDDNNKSILEYADWMLVGAVLFCALSTNIMPWEYLSRIMSFVQFPWRFFLIASVLLVMADAIIIMCFVENVSKEFLNDQRDNDGRIDVIWSVAVSIIFIAMSATALVHQSENAQGYYDYANDYYSYKPYTCNVIGGEWLPEAVTDQDRILDQSELMLGNDGSEIDFNRVNGKIISEITNNYDYIDVPFIYYKGYTATISDANQNKLQLSVDGNGDNGFTRVFLNGNTGTLNVSYAGTALLKASYILSLIGVIIAALYFIRRRGNK